MAGKAVYNALTLAIYINRSELDHLLKFAELSVPLQIFRTMTYTAQVTITLDPNSRDMLREAAREELKLYDRNFMKQVTDDDLKRADLKSKEDNNG